MRYKGSPVALVCKRAVVSSRGVFASEGMIMDPFTTSPTTCRQMWLDIGIPWSISRGSASEVSLFCFEMFDVPFKNEDLLLQSQDVLSKCSILKLKGIFQNVYP